MESDARNTAWRDWTLFGLRWAFLVLISAIHLLWRAEQGITGIGSDLLTAIGIAALANLAYGGLIFIPAIRRALPIVILLGDWVTAGLFVNLSQGQPLLIVATSSAIILSGLLRLEWSWGIVQAIGVFLVTLGVLVAPSGGASVSATLDTFTIPLLVIALIALLSGVWSFMLDRQVTTHHKQMTDFATNKADQLSDLRERTRAIYEMAAALSSSLNYEKILDAAMNAGRLGLREYANQRLVSAVLLFRADNKLHVVTARGLSATDEHRVIPGQQGVVAEALVQCIPIFGKIPHKDPELQYFVGFQGMRSVLCIPLRAGFDSYGVLLYGSDKADAFTEEHIDLLTAVGTQATVALQNAVLYRNILEEKERIVEVEEDARKKLARDLHDGPTQTISAIAMRMSYIYRLLEREPAQVPAELKKVEELARQTTKEIRHMLFTLRPLVLESQGLNAALDQLAQKMKETHNQAVAVRVSPDAEKALSSHQHGVVFYIIEEAVNNARKHAEAELISVTVMKQGDVALVQIADNGVGFDMGAVDANYDRRGSLGMVNMRERAELLNGSLRIESAEGKGTTITVVVPLEGSAAVAERKSTQPRMAATKLALNARSRIESTDR